MTLFLDSIFFSYSQIFFSNRKWFGVIASVATFVIPKLGLMALLGVVISNFLAFILKFDKNKTRSGFYGFNGILFGAAASFYFELSPFLLLVIPIFIIITFFISAALEHYLASAFNLPGLSLPFVFSLYIFFIFLGNYDFIDYKYFEFVGFEYLSSLHPLAITYLKSISLILFQSSVISGLILAIAIFFFSRILFLLSIIAFLFNYLFLHLVLFEQNETVLILTSFNSILTAFALGGSLIISSRKSIFLVSLATLIVVIFTVFFIKLLSGFLLPVLVFSTGYT
jgi:urea transporter